MMKIDFWLRVLPLAVAATVGGAQQVLVVDPAGVPNTYPDIQAAVDAASVGATILVKNGEYTGVTIARGLKLIADGTSVSLTESLEIERVPPGESVLVRGVSSSLLSLSIGPRVEVLDCEGSVWIEDCDFAGGFLAGPGLCVRNSSIVSISHCRIDAGVPFGGVTYDGLTADRSTVHVFDCSVVGGVGSSVVGNAMPGGAAVQATESTLYLNAVTAVGGQGGGALVCDLSGDGGPGLRADRLSRVREVGSTFVGGSPGLNHCGPIGVFGDSTTILAGSSLSSLGSASRALRADALVREGDTIDFEITGQAGDLVALAVSNAQQPAFYSFLGGTLLVGPVIDGIPVGTLPATGTLIVRSSSPAELGPGVDLRTYYVQLLAISTAGEPWVGSAQSVTMLDSRF